MHDPFGLLVGWAGVTLCVVEQEEVVFLLLLTHQKETLLCVYVSVSRQPKSARLNGGGHDCRRLLNCFLLAPSSSFLF